MQTLNFDEIVQQMAATDRRYHRDAYHFLREALDYTQKISAREQRASATRHVTGRELLEGIREYALQQYGPLTLMVLNEWGIHTTEDFGELVFNMVGNNLLAKTDNDSREDFKVVYDFHTVFRLPFMPAKPVSLPLPAHSPARS